MMLKLLNNEFQNQNESSHYLDKGNENEMIKHASYIAHFFLLQRAYTHKCDGTNNAKRDIGLLFSCSNNTYQGKT